MRRRNRDRACRCLRVEALESRCLLSVVTVNFNDVRQTIDGFGASSAWITQNVDSSQQQLLWSTTNGAGLSLLRSKIVTDTSSGSWEVGTMQKAQAMGVTVWSTPWSPPAEWKSNGTIGNGGSLLSSHYQDYANWLKQYVINMQNNGITIYAVSMQNEPDWTADYDSCRWTAQQFHDVLPIVHDTLAADSRTANVMIILPEATHWNSWDLVSQVMTDPVQSNYTNIIYAGHNYGNYGYGPVSGLNGHQLWETEHSGTDNRLGITAGLDEAETIYNIIAKSEANAFHHWWINASGSAGLLGGNWQSTKVFSAMAHYSKFIRPGWVKVGESDDGGLLISAFKNPATGDFATVLVNKSSAAITETINLNGAYAPVITPWVTSATLDVAQQQSIPATGNGGSYAYTVPAKSIVTLTGTATATQVSEVPVGLLAAAATTSTITLSWTNNLTSATGYTLQRSSDGATWTTLTSTLSPSTYTYTNSGLTANTLSYYRVKANNGTLYSNVVASMTQPPAPSNLTASYNAANQNVTLAWTGSGSAATDYAVDVSTDGGSTWTTQSAGIASGATSYTDTKAPELATVQYRVRAVYGANSSAPTNVATVTTTVLKAPTGLTVTAGGNSAVLTWTDATTTNATVSIERSTDGINWTVRSTVNHGVQTFTDAAVTEGGTYYYRIRNDLNPTYSSYTTSPATIVPPAAPTHVEVVFSPSPTLAARVLWSDNSTQNTAYEVERSADGGATWTTLTTTLPADATSYTDTTVTSGQAYRYRVTALLAALPSASVATLSEVASALPGPYAHGDIGDAATVGLAGSATYNASTGAYTLAGAGADIWNTADGFHFAYTTLTGDGSYVARVASMANFANYGKAGIMMRNSLDPRSAYAIAFLTPQGTVNFEERPAAGASAANRGSRAGFAAPVWLKLSRSGSAFAVYYGTDGTSWTQLGSSFTIAMGSTIYVGLITSSHNSNQLATATFTNAALTGTGNQAPTVATAASASPSPVTGTTANLSVLGADDAGEGNLTYTWATTGTPPAPVNFSNNGQNAGKNSVATFSQPGSYSLAVTLTDQFGLSTTSTVDVTVAQTASSITVSPTGVTVAPNGQKQFSITAYDQFGALIASPSGVVWSNSLSSFGSIDAATGLFTASGLPGITTVTATLGSLSSSALVNVSALPTPWAWYRFDDGSGASAADSSGNGRTATLANGPTWTTGEFNGGLALNGTSQSVAVPALNLNSNAITFSGWIKRNGAQSDYAGIVFYRNGAGTASGISMRSSGQLAYHWNDASASWSWSSGLTVPDGVWTFVALVITPSNATMYMQPVGAARQSAVNTAAHAARAFSGAASIGQDPLGGRFFKGSVDDVRLYNAALSATNIAALVDLPPVVATAAAATPNPATGMAAALSVRGADSNGRSEATLTYTWTTTGTPPAPVVFSANGNNAAQDTTATFTKAGNYSFVVTITDLAGQSTTSTVSVAVMEPATAGNDVIRIVRSPSDPTKAAVFVNNAGPTPNYLLALADTAPWQFNGLAGDDELLLDFTYGNPLPMGGLSFDGGAGVNTLAIAAAARNDTLTLTATQLMVNGSSVVNLANVEAFSLDLGAGKLDLGGTTQTVGSVTLVSGQITHGTLNAAAYTIFGGTVSAQLGPGNIIKQTTGPATVTTPINATTVDVQGGQLTTPSIVTDTLTISAGAKLRIATSGGVSGTSVINFLNIAGPGGGFNWSVGSNGTTPVAAVSALVNDATPLAASESAAVSPYDVANPHIAAVDLSWVRVGVGSHAPGQATAGVNAIWMDASATAPRMIEATRVANDYSNVLWIGAYLDEALRAYQPAWKTAGLEDAISELVPARKGPMNWLASRTYRAWQSPEALVMRR